MLAFVRGRSVSTGELHVQALSAGFAPLGDPQRLSAEGRIYHGVAWSADGRDVIVSSGNPGHVALWRFALQRPDQPDRLSPSGDDWRQPTVAMQQGRLAFSRARWDENLWTLALSASGRPVGTPVSLSGSTRSELNAQFSRDGTRIVFESDRSGTAELWVANRDGRNAVKLTSFNGRLGGTPTWSPDGQWITYDLRDQGQGDIYVISARGGAERRITDHPADDLVPTWSRDGRWIYFTSWRTGKPQLHKVSPRGGEPVPVTRQSGGCRAFESFDSGYIYYSRIDTVPSNTLWRVPMAGGEEVQILGAIASWANYAVARDGIYFESPPPSSPLGHRPILSAFTRPEATIDFLSFVTGKVTRVLTVPRHAGHGFDVSPDGRTLLFAQMDAFTEDLMLVENFR
jgi:Tol biopolymer transport system component